MKRNTQALAINSLMITVSTSLITTMLHEGAHYAAARFMNVPASLHHNYVRTPNNTPLAVATIEAAAGPLFSLIFGALVLIFSIRYPKPSLLKLFTLWLGMQGILSFLGYILIAPIARAGDTGKVFAYFGVPVYVSIGIAIGSFIYINRLFSGFAKYFAFYKAGKFSTKNEDCQQLLIYPIIGSIILGTLLNLPVVIWVSLLPTVFMPMTYFATMGSYKRLQISTDQLIIDKISIPLVTLTIITIAFFRYLV